MLNSSLILLWGCGGAKATASALQSFASEWTVAILGLFHPASAQTARTEGVALLLVLVLLALGFGYVRMLIALGLL
jgi:hypothetical protein